MAGPVSRAAPPEDDLSWMEAALEQASMAYERGEVPVGAVVVRDGRIVSRAFNLKESLHDPTAHAERLALTLAGASLGSWRLDDCSLYVTLEPCVMCAGAIVQSRIRRLIYAVADPKAGACESLYRIVNDPRLNHRVSVTRGILSDPCGAILTRFFLERRLAKLHPTTTHPIEDPRRGA